MPPKQRSRNPQKYRGAKAPRPKLGPPAPLPKKGGGGFSLSAVKDLLGDAPSPVDLGRGYVKGSKAVGGALFEGVGKPVIRLAADAAPGTTGPTGVKVAPKRSKQAKEADLEALLGKSVVNLALHGDTPNNWKEAAGLTVGVLGVVPIGRLPKTAATIAKATSAAKRERLTVKAAERIAAKHSPAEIAAQRKVIAERLAKPGKVKATAVPRTKEAIEARIALLDKQTKKTVDAMAGKLRAEGAGVGERRSMRELPKAFSRGEYESMRKAAYEKKRLAFEKRSPGQVYPGPHWTEPDPAWGHPKDMTQEQYDLLLAEGDPNMVLHVATDLSPAAYRDLAVRKLYEQLKPLASKGNPQARSFIRKLEERDSLQSLLQKNAAADLFPEEATGLGFDLRVTSTRDKQLQVQDDILARAEELLPKPLQGPKTLDETVQEALPGARAARAEQDAGYSAVRGERGSAAVRSFNEAGGGLAGKAAYFQALKGELPKVPLDGELQDLTPETLGMMFNRVSDAFDSGVLREYEMGRAMAGLTKFSEGVTPQPSELDLIEKVFGAPMAVVMSDPVALGKMAWLRRHGIDLWNAPRSLQASLDVSAPFRQGLVLGMRHPVVFGKNFAPMLKSLRSDDFALDVMREINSRPYADLADRAKLARTQTHGADIGSREEMVPSALTDKIPGIRASARAYTVFLNKMRADVFDMMIDQAKASGKNIEDPKFLKALGEYLNTATGRGNLGWHKFEESADLLNSFLFSPRLLASRFQILNPNYYLRMYKADPWLAYQAARASGQTLGAISAFLYLGSLVPGVSVGLDPRSANFGKMRLRDTRVDVAAGFIPLVNLFTRMATRETVSSATGEKKQLSGEFGESSVADVLQRFVESKLAPSPGTAWSVLNQRTFTGDPITPANTLLPLVVPLNAQGAFDAYTTENSPAFAGAAYGLGSIGFGVGSYPDRAPGKSSGGRKKSSSAGNRFRSGGSVPSGNRFR